MKTTITILAIIFLVTIINSTAEAASFSSLANGAWSDPCTWNQRDSNGNCSGSVPGASDSVQISHIVTGDGASQSLMLIGVIKGSVGVAGSLNFNGTSFNNSGTLDIGSSTLNFNGTVAFNNEGTITGTGTVRFAPSDGLAEFYSGTNFAPGVTIASGTVDYHSSFSGGVINGPLVIDAGATLGLSGASLTVNNDVTVNGTLTTLDTLGSNFTFNGSSFINNGAVTKGAQNSGLVFTFNNSGAARSQTLIGTGSWTLRRLVIGGGSSSPTTLTLQNDVTVDAGATFSLVGSVGIAVSGDATINGTLNRPAGGNSVSLFFQGATFANNGVVAGGSLFINFGNFTGLPQAQNLAGVGSWTGSAGLVIRSESTTTLQNNVTYDGGALDVSGRINTGAFTLSLPCNVTWSGTGDVVGNVRRTNLPACSAPIAFGNPFTTIQFTSGEAPTEITVNVTLAPPPGFPNAVRRTYLITPVGGSGYAATLRLHYLDSELNGNNEQAIQFWRKDGSVWNAQGATVRNTTENWVEFAGVTQFSPWTLSDFAPIGPTAASVALAGRVITPRGKGASKVRVTLTGAGGVTRSALTNPFGYYRFDEVSVGDTYILEVHSKRNVFAPQVVFVTQEITDLNFTLDPQL